MPDLAQVNEELLKEAERKKYYCKHCGSPVPHNSSCKGYGDHAVVDDQWLAEHATDLPPTPIPKGKFPPGEKKEAYIPESKTETRDILSLAEYLRTGICKDQNINRAVQEYIEAVKAESGVSAKVAKATLIPMLLAQRTCLTVILMAEKELAIQGTVIDVRGEPRGIMKFLSSYLTCFRHGQQALGMLNRTRAKMAARPTNLTDIEKEYSRKGKKGPVSEEDEDE